MVNRRKFIQYAGLTSSAASFSFKGFSMNTMPRIPFLHALAANGNPRDRVLVLIQLIGGNDGLNTFIPLDQYTNLSKLRKNILIPEKEILRIQGAPSNGFHPAMTDLRNLYDEGKLSVVQNVGYPNQDYSHFRSIDIWMSASDSDKFVETGWLGRHLQSKYSAFPVGYPNSDMPDPLAIQIGSIISLALMGDPVPMGFAVNDTESFYQFVNDVVEKAPSTPFGDELEYIRLISQQAQVYYEVIKKAASKGKNLSQKYPSKDNYLADQLRIVAQLISGGLKTPVYIVTLDGFDSHSDQVDAVMGPSKGSHAELLGKVSEAIGAFQDDLKKLGIDDRVAGMTFSEFGRTIASNASLGTDHGAAAPLFVFGTNVIPGIIGSNPKVKDQLDASEDIPMEHDFRAVYASTLQDWFELPNPELVLKNKFPILPIFKKTTSGGQNPNGDTLDQTFNYPNPFHGFTTIKFAAPTGGNVVINLLDASGRWLENLENKYYAPGTYQLTVSLAQLPSGNYFYQLKIGSDSVVKKLIVY
jgi:uncharacterized protein (DUF1501 family)